MTKVARTVAAMGIFALVFLPGLRAIAAETATQVEEAVRTFAAERMSESGVPGMVFVMAGANGELVTAAFGSADVGSGREMTVDTPLRVGSISKPVTAALAFEVAVRGHLNLDEPVDTYLDVDLTDRYGEASTVRQLLQHRGGYPDAFVESHHLDEGDALDLNEWVEQLADRSIAPDVVASYSSVGYTLAGAGIAGAAGGEFADVADEFLFEPLGMDGASFARQVPANVAIGYSGAGELVPYPLDTPDLVPGAGLTATGQDIGAFINALLTTDSPLDETTQRALLRPAGPYPGLRGYTTGLTEWRYENRSALYHEGNGIGTTNRLTILPDAGVGFFTAVNSEALVGMGDPSLQTLFIRDLHAMLVETFYPGPFEIEDVPNAVGRGRQVDAQPGIYVPSRLDTGSVLRLEALVSQFEMSGEGTVFYGGPDGVGYATKGGTSSYRVAAWWETLPFNAAVVGGSLLVAMVGTVLAARRARGSVRWLAVVTGVLTTAFVALLGYGMATVEVMGLFTGIPTPIRLAQLALGGAIVTGTALLTLSATRRELPARVTFGSGAVGVATATLGAWAWIWQVVPV